MKKRQEKKQTKKEKLLLETSLQIDKFVRDSTDILIRKWLSEKSCFSSYFVLYEFKCGLIKNLIEFYLLVKICNSPSEAIASWSRRFKIRELKSKIILESLMAKVFGSLEYSDKKKYLSQVEALVFYLLNNFDTGLKGIVGGFGADEIVKFKILDSSDYKNFLEKYKNRKCIPLDRFWRKNLAKLDMLISGKTAFGKGKNLKAIYKKLLAVKKDFSNSNKYTINKGLGDVVIAVDCPKSLRISTLDRSFETLCSLLQKAHPLIVR